MIPSYEEVSYGAEDGVAVVALNRPERLNAMSRFMIDELHDALDHIERDRNVHVVVLTGTGRAFCAGIDLNYGLDMWPDPAERVHGRYWTQQRFSRLVLRMREIPQPVIAAVHGPACGGGLALATAADIRVADPTAKLNVAFVRVGLTGGDMGTSWFLPRLVGPSAAAELMYTGRFVEADEALRLGLVSKITKPGEDVDAARSLARQILQNTPFGVQLTKEMLNQSLAAQSLQAMAELENRSQVLCSFTEGSAEAISTFLSRGERAEMKGAANGDE